MTDPRLAAGAQAGHPEPAIVTLGQLEAALRAHNSGEPVWIDGTGGTYSCSYSRTTTAGTIISGSAWNCPTPQAAFQSAVDSETSVPSISAIDAVAGEFV